MERPVSKSLLVIGIFHTLFGLFFFGGPLVEMLFEGLINSSRGIVEREFTIWFLYGGVLFLLLSVVIGRLEREALELPRQLGWGLLALAVVGAAITPASGFWLLLIPALLALRRKR